MIPTIAAGGLLLLPLPPDPDTRATALHDWLEGLEVDPRVTAEIREYDRKGTRASAGYAEAVARGIRTRVIDEVGAAFRREIGEARGEVDASTPGTGIATAADAGFDEKIRETFEESFVRVEVLAFFPADGVSAREALTEYVSPAFRKKASSRIVDIERNEELTCIETRGVGGGLVDPMDSCNRITELHESGLSSQHSQLVSNSGRDGFQRIYFKESVKTFAEVAGGLLFHYVNYSRSTGLNRLERMIARKKIRGSQEKALEEMAAFLAGK